MPLNTLTLSSAAVLLRKQTGDTDNRFWPTDTPLMDAIGLAMREAWPDFFNPVVDTTYQGIGLVPYNAESVAVPTAFLGGAIDRLVYRPTYGRLTGGVAPALVRNRWTTLTKQYTIDPLNQPSPLIRFQRAELNDFELQIYGRSPLTIPVTGSDVIQCSNIPGFLTWVMWLAEYYLRSGNHHAQTFDRDAFAARRLIAEQKATEARKRGKMITPMETMRSIY